MESGLRLAKVGDFNRLLQRLFYRDLDGLFNGIWMETCTEISMGSSTGDGLLEGDLSEDLLGDFNRLLRALLFRFGITGYV
jgi:hypothetical protein